MKMSWMFIVVVGTLVGLQSSAEAAESLGHTLSGTTLKGLLRAAGLMDTLNNDGPYTLFVPSDMYLEQYLITHGISVRQLQKDPAALKEFLLYHVVNGTISRDQLYNERLLTSLNGKTIRVNNYADGHRITVQGVPLQNRDKVATNGLIHYLYGPMQAANGTITDVINSHSQLSTLMTAAHAAGIDEFLADQSPITLFAPTDAAFAALGDKVNTLLQNPELLAEILQYHIVPGTLYSAGIHGTELPTFDADHTLHLMSHLGQPSIEGAHLMRHGVDFSATNGVVHEINHVLIPESLKNQI